MSASNAMRTRTSLPAEIDEGVRSGRVLVGDDFSPAQISRWFAEEKEAFFADDHGNSHVDPFYAYMRSLTCLLGAAATRAVPGLRRSMLVLGPGPGLEVDDIIDRGCEWDVTFVEASENFRRQLAARFPTSIVVAATESGGLGVASNSMDLVLALSVLHHIPNVSFILTEFSRVLRPDGFAIVREPCSSMGDWRTPRSATPNERGISKRWMLGAAERAGLGPARAPVPVLFHPLSLAFKKLRLERLMYMRAYYWLDLLCSRGVQWNDSYWRDAWYKKLGPSAYFYLFKKSAPKRRA